MIQVLRWVKSAAIVAVLSVLIFPRTANAGASVARFSPTHPGETTVWVDDPVYGLVPRFAAALTLDYAHNPLVLGIRPQGGQFQEMNAIVAHQLWGHAQLGLSVANRLALSVSVPMRLVDEGDARFGISPTTGLGLGDIRGSAMVRLLNDGQKDAYSAHLGLSLWFPSAGSSHTGDDFLRAQARLVWSGRIDWLRWGALGAFTYRKEAALGTLAEGAGNTVGSELSGGARVGWASSDDSFLLQPEFILSAATPGGHWLQRSYTAVETSIGAHMRLPGGWVFTLAPGFGALKQPGTPDFRVVARFAWMAPDQRPPEPVLTPDVVVVAPPPPPPPPAPAPPPPDQDSDGIVDAKDACPTQARGANPDPTKDGCPAADDDGDTIWNHEDLCPSVTALPIADPQKRGCPLPDRDGDTVGDAIDACPDKPGAPNTDVKKNGCPGLVQVREGKLVILSPVFFATNKAKVLKKSFPVLTAVADALAAQPQIKKVRVEGHTDDRGNADKNTDLSKRRAESVRQFLIEKGVNPSRLDAEGFGPSQPIETNKTSKGRAANRRVDFKILERKDETL